MRIEPTRRLPVTPGEAPPAAPPVPRRGPARSSPDRLDAPPATRFDPGDPRQVEALAREYAPIRYLHPQEKYGPGDPEGFIRNARVREHRSWRPDRTPGGFGQGEIDPARLGELRGGEYYLDLEDSDAARRGSPDAPSFFQYDEKTRTMTYWQFYNYNDAPGPPGFDHEGDWERVTVQFDADHQPTEVRYSAHSGHTTLPWDEAPKEDGRPVVYVGRGSHANSPYTGSIPTGVPGVNDAFGKGERVDDAARPLRSIRDEAWYDAPVRWGQRGKLAIIGQTFTSGPSGPGAGKGPLR